MNSSRSFSLRLFGSPSLVRRDGSIVAGRAAQRHRLALLALLALAPGHSATRDRLLAYLWPESDTERARQLLNQAVYQLRKELGEGAILSAGDELRLNPEVIDVDATSFEAALASGDVTAAAALYQGPLLDGFFLSDAPEFEHWLDRERDRLAGARARALESLAEAAEAQGDFRGAAEWWRARAAHDPYDSRVALRLMEALVSGGNRAGALQHATTHARLLHDEFAIAPAPEIAALTERLRGEAVPEPPVSRGGNGAHAVTAVQTDLPADTVVPTALPAEAAAPSASRASVAAPTALHAVAFASSDRLDGPAAVSVDDGDVGSSERMVGTSRRKPRLGYAATAVVVTALGASSLWLIGRDRDTRWLLNEAMPRIDESLAVADWEAAFGLVREADARVPGSREVAELWPRVSWRVTIASEPAGATVFRQAYDATGEAWEELGRTPLTDIRIPYGLSRLRFELDGYRPLVRALGGAHINWSELRSPAAPDMLLVGPETYRLDSDATLPPALVRVPGWSMRLGADSLRLNDFFLGRYEVTNADFKAFVDAGGYQRPELWDPIVVRNDTVPWASAMAQFVDRTGRPGPSTWEAGDYPHGEADFPVSGVSWYEAAAYARFVGQELPTSHHWQQALANSMFPWLLPASNFSGAARRVTESRALSHVGAFDMTGNVREWTSTAIGSERVILGGSWNDPYYIAGTDDTSAPPEDRSPGNGFRIAMTRDDAAIATRVRAPIVARTTAPVVVEQQPVSDEVYAAFSRVFDYDRRALDPLVEVIDTTRLWTRERVHFDAGYGSERMLLHLYLPTTGSPPHQTVVYWPGWDTFTLRDADEYFTKQVDFIVKSGRAVAFPIYRGTFERGTGRRRPEFGTAEYRDNTIVTVKELRRTIDYLETRNDIDARSLAFFGYSWGGVNGPTAIAQEPRIRAAVIYIGLLPAMAATPEVDPVHALPRVRVPTLTFSGEFDPMVPRNNSKRYFELIGAPPDSKRHVIAIGGHFVPRDLLIRETLDWLDRYLGRVDR